MNENRSKLDSLASALLEHETIDSEDVKQILNEKELESGQETTESENSSGPKTAEIPALQSYSSPTESKEPS